MKKILLLLKVYILDYFSLNEVLGKKQNRKKSNIILVVGMAIIIILLGCYSYLIANSLCSAGQGNLIPSYMVSISSFIILFLTIFKVNGFLFGAKDYERLITLPVSKQHIIISKFLFIYVFNLGICLIYFIPGSIVWMRNINPILGVLISYLLSALFVPLIPMSIALILGAGIIYVSGKFKNTNIISVIISFCILIVTLCWVMFNMNEQGDITDIGEIIGKQISAIYFLSNFYNFRAGLEIIQITTFDILSIFLCWIFIKVVSDKYESVNELISNSIDKKNNRKEKKFRQRNKFCALYRKEVGRYLNSYMCVLNTAFGIVILSILSIVLLMLPLKVIMEFLRLESLEVTFSSYIAMIICSFICISCPAASLLSLEGKNFWIVETLPISLFMILKAKIAVNISLHLIGYLIAVICFTLKVPMDVLMYMTMIIVPLIYSLFVSIQGVYINCKFPRFNWDNEMIVVKQSKAVIFSGIINITVIVIPIAANFATGIPIVYFMWGMALVLIIISLMLFNKMKNINFYEMEKYYE